jgi:hypothetical protein
MAVKKKVMPKKKVAAKKKVVKRKVISVKPLGKSVSKPKAPKSTKPKRVLTGTGWRRMMMKAKGIKTTK